MEMASFEGFLRTLVEIIAIYYVVRFVARLVFPMLVKKAVRHAEDNFRQQFGQQFGQQQQQQQYARNESDVTIDNAKAAKSRETKKVGEYIDYEEID